MKLPSHSPLLVALSQSVAGREKFPGRIGGEGHIGQAAPPFELKAWLNADPLEHLKGNVLTDTCPFCDGARAAGTASTEVGASGSSASFTPSGASNGCEALRLHLSRWPSTRIG